MTEASLFRLQKMLDDQKAWNDRLNAQIMRQGFEIVGYRTRNKQLEAALRRISDLTERWEHDLISQVNEIAQKALEWKND
jgi:hypothetical protein